MAGEVSGQWGEVHWFTLEDLGVLIRRHRADDSLIKAVGRILRSELIVVDDIGLLPVSSDAAEGLYRLVDAAYEKRSVAISSNLHPSKARMFGPTYARWHRILIGPGQSGAPRCRRRQSHSAGRLAQSCRTQWR
jgi:DNA replication protein DnaC